LDQKTNQHFEVIVIGVGSMGAAACWNLAQRGYSVLGLEQYDLPHDKGSHAGQTRIIRNAYFEHADYVPLLQRAYRNWRDFEALTESMFYYQTGIVYFGHPDNENIRGIRQSARLHDIAIENLESGQDRERYPAFEIPPDFDVIFEPDAGFVTPERAIRMYADEAIRNGAVIKTRAPVLSWKKESGKLQVFTKEGDYSCDKLVITAGAWASHVIPSLKTELVVTRQFLVWVQPPDPAVFSLGNFPCWFVEDPTLGTFYGFPYLPPEKFGDPIGLKLAHHHPGAPCKPGDNAEPISAEEEQTIREFLRTYLPKAGEQIGTVKSCLYTYSPDTHFIIDHLPGFGRDVTIACGFSGHGFKFVPVVGEILADLAMKGGSDLPIGFLGLDRF
jgi:sarcosine oxidase